MKRKGLVSTTENLKQFARFKLAIGILWIVIVLIDVIISGVRFGNLFPLLGAVLYNAFVIHEFWRVHKNPMRELAEHNDERKRQIREKSAAITFFAGIMGAWVVILIGFVRSSIELMAGGMGMLFLLIIVQVISYFVIQRKM